jgi:hypothetical protein
VGLEIWFCATQSWVGSAAKLTTRAAGKAVHCIDLRNLILTFMMYRSPTVLELDRI